MKYWTEWGGTVIPKSRYFTPEVSKSGKYAYYRFPASWIIGETCNIEPTKTGAVVTFPGSIELIGQAKRAKGNRVDYKAAKVAAGILPFRKYRLDQFEDRLEITWRDE